MKVKNMKGIRCARCKNCGPWIYHWENVLNTKVGSCSKIGCSKDAKDGALVQFADSKDTEVYIVPLCGPCNQPNIESIFEVNGRMMVYADSSKNCGTKAANLKMFSEYLKRNT